MRTSGDELLPVPSVLERADTYYTTVTDRRGNSSRKAELVFYLAGVKKKFVLVENIGDGYTLPAYEQIKQGLDRSDSVTVWIREDEASYVEPKVFQITTDRQTLLAFEAVKFKERPIILFLMLGGLGCIILPVHVFFPGVFRRK